MRLQELSSQTLLLRNGRREALSRERGKRRKANLNIECPRDVLIPRKSWKIWCKGTRKTVAKEIVGETSVVCGFLRM